MSGNVTKRGTVKHGQISCHPIFAGKRKVEYKPSFFEALEKRESVVFDANTLIERAMKDVQEIITGLKENPIVEFGSTSWFKVNLRNDKEVVIEKEETGEVAPSSSVYSLS